MSLCSRGSKKTSAQGGYTMARNRSVFAVGVLGVLALIAVTHVPAERSGDPVVPRFVPQANITPPDTAPIIVAQGRCYNGKCY